MPKTKSTVLQLVTAVAGVVIITLGVVMFNNVMLLTLPIGIRMVLMIVTQWLLFFVPGILMLTNKESLRGFGFTKKELLRQIVIGVLIAGSMSVLLTVIPILLGFKDMVGSTNYTQFWQFAYQFLYAILGVALAEELIFRGYLFYKLLEVKKSRWFAIIFSSILFGLFHIFSGNPVQMFMTALLGFSYCMCREKIKNCTILSLILAHGIYDALIVLWVGIL